LLLLLISGQIRDTTTARLTAKDAPPAAPLLISPTPESSISPQHPTASATPAASVKQPSATPEAESAPTDDAEIQAAIDKKLQDDSALADLNITATVAQGVVTVVGTVTSDDLKAKIERLVRTTKGVKRLNSQIVVVTN